MDRIPDASERMEDSHSRVSLADPAASVVNNDSSSKARKKNRKRDRKDTADEPEALRETDDVMNILDAEAEEAIGQRALVRTAFLEGIQEDDFEDEQEKLAADAEEKEKNRNTELAGWGHWTGDSAPVRKPRKEPKASQSDASQQRRQPARVQILEGEAKLNAEKASAKYFVDKVPAEFQNPLQYEQQMRMPTGPEWN